jgi:nicotinate phosphoribosyltransferase
MADHAARAHRPDAAPPPCGREDALLTDLYQLTMLDAYLASGMTDIAVFEFFVRGLPAGRSYLVAAGLEPLLDYLEGLAFDRAQIGWLESTGRFTPALLDYLGGFRFAGEVRAMPEGTVFFADEPIVQVIAPLPHAQLVESRLINLVQFPTLVASKAARCVLAAQGKLLVDFGMRRSHGAEAAMAAARASWIAGFGGTSTVLAEARYGIPAYGTMAHSFIQAHDTENAAFEHFARQYPDGSVLLIDTYDTLAGAAKVVRLAARLRAEGVRIRAVRLDSGDLLSLAREVRRILDDGDCRDIDIFCSGGLDEYALADGLAAAPVSGFGIGTSLDVSADAPSLDCAYKIQEYAGEARRKRSAGKATWPGRKQVDRHYGFDNRLANDSIALASERRTGRPLLETVMRDGKRIGPSPALSSVRAYAREELGRLPVAMHDPRACVNYPVHVSERVISLADVVDRSAH